MSSTEVSMFKPVAYAAYSLSLTGGVRYVEHRSAVTVETEAVSIRTPTLVPTIANAFAAEGQPVTPFLNITLTVMLDDLAWIGYALKTARRAGEPSPARYASERPLRDDFASHARRTVLTARYLNPRE